MAEILGWVKNLFFYIKYSKSEIFQKVLPSFVVVSSTKNLWKTVWKIFRHGGTIQDGGFWTFFSKTLQKSMNKYFSIL
jgi:hypothetical protein